MSNPQLIAEEIKLKVVVLLEQKHELKKRLVQLDAENQQLRNEVQSQKNEIKALEETNKIVKLAGTLSGSENDIQLIKKKLTGYIKDIDECIRLLSNR